MAKITHNISSPNDDLGDQLRTAFGNQNTMNTELYDTKVGKVAGKDLSTNDFTNTDKAKLDVLNAGAEVNVQSDWEQNDNTADDYIKNKPAEMFSSVGSFHYVDLATQTTPLTVLAGVEKKITNDIADSETNVLNAPYGITTMWNVANNQLDFTQTSIGDLVTVIPAIEITTTAVNQNFSIYIKMGIGSLTPTTKQVYNGALAVVGSVIVNAARDFTIDTLDNKDYPAEIFILSNANATVKSGELDIKVVRKDINVVAVANLDLNDTMAIGNFTGENLEFRAGAGMQYYTGVYTSHINSENLTANRGIDFPNKSGVVALISDIVGGGGAAVTEVNGFIGEVVLNQDDILDGATYKQYSGTEKSKLASITEIFTTALKTAYDDVVTWIATNGSNVLNHLSNTSNPHSVTKAQVGLSNVPNLSFSGTNTGDNATNTQYSGLAASKQDALVSGTNIKTINGISVLGSGDMVVVSSETTTTLGALIGGAADATPNDTDFIATSLTAGGILKKITWTNAKAFLKIYFDTLYATIEPAQITITTSVSITTATLDSNSKGQSGKNVVIDNGVNAINITVNGGTAFLASYLKHGTGAITFVQGSGRTLYLTDLTAVLNGSVGSTATISSIGTKDYLRISNV